MDVDMEALHGKWTGNGSRTYTLKVRAFLGCVVSDESATDCKFRGKVLITKKSTKYQNQSGLNDFSSA